MKMQGHDEYWIQQALLEAQQAALAGEVPVGAVLVSDGALLASGFNQPISRCDPTAHAEIVVLRQAALQCQNYRLPPATTLYVTREPCLMCLGAIMHARVARLVFGAWDSRSGAVQQVCQGPLEQTLNHRLQYTGGILAESCAMLLKEFFAKRR